MLEVVLTGANGRMGRTLRGLLERDDGCRLSGVVVLPEETEESRKSGTTPVFFEMERALAGLGAGPSAIIDFTTPEASLSFARAAARHNTAQVIGTTGFNPEQRAELAVLAQKTPILWSPNMSIGVNALAALLPELAKMLGPEYDLDILEMHHNKKKDAPSGTALRLGEVLAEACGRRLDNCACFHREGLAGERPKGQIGLQALRGGDVAGVHTVYFMGSGERIEVTHHAHSRENFAQGAIRAAKWLAGMSPGRLYGIPDMLTKGGF
jgi:4-hydroxy-tetrahydrodipicolinate reductase